MFEFLNKYLLLLILATSVVACSKYSDVKPDTNADGNESPERATMFSGLSRYSPEQQTPSNTEEAKTPEKTFAKVVPGYDISFPFDHASHPEFAVDGGTSRRI